MPHFKEEARLERRAVSGSLSSKGASFNAVYLLFLPRCVHSPPQQRISHYITATLCFLLL